MELSTELENLRDNWLTALRNFCIYNLSCDRAQLARERARQVREASSRLLQGRRRLDTSTEDSLCSGLGQCGLGEGSSLLQRNLY